LKDFGDRSHNHKNNKTDPLEQDTSSDDLGEPGGNTSLLARDAANSSSFASAALIWPQFRCGCHFLLFELLLDGAKGKRLGDLCVLYLFIL
jgi:hypothetical protein